MDIRRSIIRLAAFIITCVMAALVVSSRVNGDQSAGELSAQEKRGKQIYLTGETGEAEIKAILGSTDLELPASSFPCANCHGLRGEGTREGGLQPPPVDWATLMAPHRSGLTGRDRPAYNETTLARAIIAGVDSAGNKMHPGMPQYKMSAEQMRDLIAYLKKIGKESDADPGVSESTIKIGAALPMTGPLAKVGEDIKLALAACFMETNSQGGIYGRKFELVVEDSRGDAASTLEATRRLVEQAGVFALVGSFEPADSSAINEYLLSKGVPLVGPVTLSPRVPVVPNRQVFYLLPSSSDQSRALVDFIGLEAVRLIKVQPLRLAVVYGSGSYDQDAVDGVKLQAKKHPMEIVCEHRYTAGQFTPGAIVETLIAKKPGYIFFFGSANDFTLFAREVEQARLEAWLLGAATMIGRGAFDLSPAVASRTYLSYPASLPNQADFGDFIAVMQKAKASLRSPAFQAVAFASAKVFIEATKSSSRQLNRAALVNSLEQLQNFKTGVTPPITFGLNRRVGAMGSNIVGIDLANKQFVPLGERIVPR